VWWDKAVTRYLNYRRDLSYRTKKEYRNDIKYLMNFSKVHDFNEISADTVQDFFESKDLSVSLYNRRVSSLGSFFKHLLSKKLVSENPFVDIKRAKRSTETPQTLNKGELEIVRQSCENKTEQIMIEIFYSTGIRLSELIGVDVSDVDIEHQTIRVLGKRNKERFVPVSDSLMPMIRDYLTWRGKTSNQAFFVTPKRHVRIYESMIARFMQRLRKSFEKRDRKVGISRIRAHLFRHTFATDAIDRGARIRAVQKMMGHSSIATTEEYVHVEEDVRTDHQIAFP